MNPPARDPATSERPDAACTVPPQVAATPPRPAPWAMRLRRHLTLALIAKLALLALLYLLFFSPSQRPHVDAGVVADRFLSPG